jgi:hypothetical protein
MHEFRAVARGRPGQGTSFAPSARHRGVDDDYGPALTPELKRRGKSGR